MNQVRSEFDLKISADQIYKIKRISKTLYWNELKFFREILDI